MEKIVYNKLIRDKIPRIIEASNKNHETHVASKEEYRTALLKKLIEEAKEVQEQPCIEELADVYEVIDAIIAEWNFSKDEILEAKRQKAESCGTFHEWLILEYVTERLEFREANVEDFDFLIHLRAKTMLEHLSNLDIAIDEAGMMERVKYKFDHSKIVMVNGMDAGLLKLDKTNRPWNLIQIQVLPQFQGRGIGEQIIKRVLSEAELQKIDVKLSVLKGNPAKKLYERLGFSVVREDDISFEMWFYNK